METLSSTPPALIIPRTEEEIAAREAAVEAAVRELGGKSMPESLYDEYRMLSMVQRAYQMDLAYEDLRDLALDQIIEIVGAQSALLALEDQMKGLREKYFLRKGIRNALSRCAWIANLAIDDQTSAIMQFQEDAIVRQFNTGSGIAWELPRNSKQPDFG